MPTRQLDWDSDKGGSTMSTTVVIPDDFVLGTDDEQVSVSYSTWGFAGPQLTYHNEADQTGVGTYAGDKLCTMQNELGKLVTVTLQESADAQRRTLTLLVPAVYFDDDKAAEGTGVVTLVIWETTLGGREARGQVQTYKERRLRGTAKYVGS